MDVPELDVRDVAGGARLTVRVKPRARRSRIVGLGPNGALKVDLAAPPVDGRANAALRRFLGREVLHIAPTRILLLRGQGARDKVLTIQGLDATTLRRLLADRI